MESMVLTQVFRVIREKITNHKDYKNGDLDMDRLCEDMQKKARCSESGMLFDQPLIDALVAKFKTDK